MCDNFTLSTPSAKRLQYASKWMYSLRTCKVCQLSGPIRFFLFFFYLSPPRPPEISAPVIARITKFGGKRVPTVNSLWCNFHGLGSISSRSNDVKWYEFCNSNVDLPILLIISTVIARNKTKIRIGRQLKQELYFSIFWNFQIKILKIRDNQRRRHDNVHWCLFLNAFWIKRQHSEAS